MSHEAMNHYKEQLHGMLTVGVNSLWLLSRVIERDGTFSLQDFTGHPVRPAPRP